MNTLTVDMGWLSLLPPLLAIGLAVWTRRVIVSLFFGLWLGVAMLHAWNPLVGLRALVVDFAFEQVTNEWNAAVLLLMLCIGGFVRLIVHSGAAEAFAASLVRLVTNRPRAHGAVWFSGIVVFFSDSANPLILGPLFAPLFDRLRISRQKLAYLIDSTASPICVLVPITSWAAFVVSLLAREYVDLPDAATPMADFVRAIPFQFYAICSLVLVPVIGLLGLEYGPMRAAERAAAERPVVTQERAAASKPPPRGVAIAGVVSLTTVAVVVLVALLWTGGFPAGRFLEALAAGNSVRAVTLGFVAGAAILVALLAAIRRMGLIDAAKDWGQGALHMYDVLLILTLAWSLGACCDALGTGTYVAGVVEQGVPPVLVPALVFLVGAVISFATGSAWGCYAILIPIAIPIAMQSAVPIHVVLAAVLSGGIFGDHSSPISDTTIMSSIGAGCRQVDHVRTQLPYAATAGVAALAGYILVGFWPTAWALPIVLVLLVTIALVLNRLPGKQTRSSVDSSR